MAAGSGVQAETPNSRPAEPLSLGLLRGAAITVIALMGIPDGNNAKGTGLWH